MKKMSLKDIAMQLGVSTATVSYILNGKAKEKRISEKLTAKVEKLIAEKQYQPDMVAKSLRTRKTNIICLMVEDIADQFFSAVAGHIETIAYEKGYKIIYSSTKNDTQRTKELIQTYRMQNVDGYIITPPVGIEDDIKALLKANLPVVLFDRYYENVKTSYVGMDNLDSSYNAVEHLYEQGYSNVAFITLDSIQTQMMDRLKGYESAVRKRKKKPLVKTFHYKSPSERELVDGIVAFLKKHPELDAIFFATNYLAINGIEAMNSLGKKIPNEMGIVAFDDNDLFRIHQPSITAVTQPIHEMSVQLINKLLHSMQPNQKYTATTVVVPASLSIRQSSQKK